MNDITQTNRTTAVVNGTAALQVALRLVGVKK
jgi:dTDP-4-amino-4,6-dideoxygalactose transaminase